MVVLSDYATDERTARILLSVFADADDPTAGEMLRRYGGVDTIRALDAPQPPDDAGVEVDVLRQRIQRAADGADLDRLMPSLLDGRYQTVIPGDADWPVGLDDLDARAPYVLWADGAASFLRLPIADRVTFDGSRASTPYGDTITGELAGDLARDEEVIVSGGAYGINAAAHKAALATGGGTIAVLAGGIDRNYPAGHHDLLAHIRDVGLVVSEQPPGALPTRSKFLARSRLLAALSAATVIPEAGARSGSLATAQQAQALGRTVGAVPGPITSAASTGPHLLLRDQRAGLIMSADDVHATIDRATEHGRLTFGNRAESPAAEDDPPHRSF